MIKFTLSLLILTATYLIGGCASSSEGPLLDKNKKIENSVLSSDLLQLRTNWMNYLKGPQTDKFVPTSPMMRINSGYVKIEAIAINNTNTLKMQLSALGMRNISTFEKYISGDLLIRSLDKASRIKELRIIRPIYAASNKQH